MSLTTEQLAMRKTFLGASEIGNVCGVNPFKGPIDVWLRKVGLATDEEDPDAEFRKNLGHRIEGLIASLYSDRTGRKLRRCGTEIHPTETWAGCTPDRKIVGMKRGVEIKNVGMRVVSHWANNEPPDYVKAQCQYQCWIMGWEAVDIAALIAGRDFVIHEVLRDDETIAMLSDIGRRFWFEHVLTGEPPPIDGSETWKNFLARKFPNSRGPLKPAPREADSIAYAYLDAMRAETEAKKAKAEAANQLRALIGDEEGIRGGDWKATWKGEDGKRTLLVKAITNKAERRAA